MFGIGLLLAWLAAPTVADAQERLSELSLRWSAPEGCPSEAAVEAEIARLLGPPRAEHARAAVDADAAVTQRGDVFELLLTPRGERSPRVLTDPTCEALAEAAALILALMLDPEAVVSASPEPEASAAPSASTGPSAPPVALRLGEPPHAPHETPLTQVSPAEVDVGAQPPAPPPPLGPPARWFVGLLASGEYGPLPLFALGPSLVLGVDTAGLRIEVSAALLAPQAVAIDALPGASAAFWGLSSRGRFCIPLLESDLFVGVCAGISSALVWAGSHGVSAPSEGLGLQVGAHAGALGALALASWLRLRLDADVTAYLSRPAYQIDGVGGVFAPELASVRVALGFELLL